MNEKNLQVVKAVLRSQTTAALRAAAKRHLATERTVIMEYKPYVPQNVRELLAYLAHMMLASPTFKDETGYLPRENIDTTFFSLNQGLLVIRKKLGEERFAALKALSDKMRALFEADPEDKTGDTHAGRMLLHEMEDILKSVAKRKASK